MYVTNVNAEHIQFIIGIFIEEFLMNYYSAIFAAWYNHML